MTRPFAPRDALRLREQQASGTALDFEAVVLLGHSPLRQALAGYWPLGTDGVETVVLDAADATSAAGFVQARRRLDPAEADLSFISPSLSKANGAALCWQRLIAGACQWLGAKGVQRIYAAIDETDRVALHVFLQVGFTVYTSDVVFRLARVPDALGPERDLASVELGASMEHQIGRIEQRMMPRGVLTREGALSGDWSSYPIGGRSPSSTTCRAWTDEQGELLGAWRLVAGRSGHWLRIVSEATSEASAAIRQALSEVRATGKLPELPFYAAARGYEPGLNLALRECGFEPVLGRFRLVKQTTARVIEPAWRQRAVREGGLDPAPTRTAPLHQSAEPRLASSYNRR